MKNRFPVTLALLALSGITFFACQKSATTTTSSSTTPSFPAEVTVVATVQGRVVDQDGIPVQGAAITSGIANTSTDINGVFTLRNISLSSRFGYIQAAKSGYFTGSRSIATNGNESNFVTIQLINRTESGNFPATSGGKIIVNTVDTVAFAAASVVNATTKSAYIGTVHVFATYLDPTSDNLTKYMPGDLRGITTAGKEVALQTYGMMSVELQDDAGNKLQLDSSKPATITAAIPSSLQSTAPATIPLWYFNDSTGRWMQQGAATRKGNNYTGNVNHFTWWNFDVIYVPHNFKAHLKDQNGNAIPYMHAVLYSNGNPMFSGYTDSTGYVQGWLPDATVCQLQILTECGNLLAGVNVGPALSDADLGTITVTLSQMGLTVKGSVVDCFNNPITSGYVNVYVDGLNYRAGVVNGAFTLTLMRCYSGNATAQFTAADLGTSQQGSTFTESGIQPGTYNVGTLSACGITINQYFTITFNGNTYTQTSDNYLHYSSGNFFCSGPYAGFYLPGLAGTGSFTPSGFYLYSGSYRLGAALDNTLKCNITEFGAVNQFITGTLTGNVYDSASANVFPATGSFKYQRTN